MSLIYSLALETNARDRLATAAVVEAALPSFYFVFPSLALGAGAIGERHRGTTSTGLRVQASASVILFSVVLAADVYPGRSGDDGIHWSLFGQLSI